MDTIDTPLNDQKAIIENNLKVINGQIYDAVINKRVGTISKDEALVKRCDELLAILMKKKDEFNVILKEVEAEISKA